MSHTTHTIVVTGGIVSGIGKGITTASLGRLLIDAGYTVAPVKADPYLNQDAGTMNPFQHGEVFVTDDGAETDLDLGHYERFLNQDLSKLSNFTSGAVYRTVMEMEREGEFLGKTIQIIPHVTEEIKRRLCLLKQQNPDFLLVEIGGTVGDIEALPFIEAIREYRVEQGETIFIHVVKMDYLYPSDEGKTKPIQHAVSTLRSYGIQPDILVVRCKRPITDDERNKIALLTGIPAKHIIPALDAPSLYHIPLELEQSGLTTAVLQSFALPLPTSHPEWKDVYTNMANRTHTVRVGLAGKYLDNEDAYLSVLEAIEHAGIYHQVFTEVIPVNPEAEDIAAQMENIDALIVPGGFGNRGVEGKIAAIQQAREKKVPYLGICLGLQTAVIEYARHKANLAKATSTEFDEATTQPVIAFLPEQVAIKRKGGTMRLGSYPAVLQAGSLAEKVYQAYRPDEVQDQSIHERHRHRFEVNPEYHSALKEAGLLLSGMSPDGSLVEFIELPEQEHPYFIATQAHPEFRSRPNLPHPLFAGLIAAAINK